MSGARAVVARTIRTVRDTAPRQARYLEKLVADAEIAAAGEAAAPWWRPETGRGTAAWLRAVVAARDTMRSHRTVARQHEKAYRELLVKADQELARARAEIRETGMGRRAGAAIERAEVATDTARKLGEHGVYEQATEKLRRALDDAAVVHRIWLDLHERYRDPRTRRRWKIIAETAIAESRDRQTFAIVVDKLRRQLILYYRGLRMATFPAELGANGLRPKQHAGDRATPEGLYRVVSRKEGRATKYYKALLLNYPNDEDRARYTEARRRGLIPRSAGIGSLIEIHGDGGEGGDWTDGCVALTDANMDTVFARVSIGTPVAIVGTYGG